MLFNVILQFVVALNIVIEGFHLNAEQCHVIPTESQVTKEIIEVNKLSKLNYYRFYSLNFTINQANTSINAI